MYKPHLRCSALGTLPGGEIFSFSWSMAHGDDEEAFYAWMFNLQPNATVYDDLRDDLVDYWNTSPVSSQAVLRSLKVARIGEDGLYVGAPQERVVGPVNVGIPGPVIAGAPVANQLALAVTLHTAGDLGRVKGRYFLPLPAITLETDGRLPENGRDTHQDRAATFITNLNNQPGVDVLDLRVVVASQGRKNPDGSVKIGPKNHIVTGASLGRVLDTIRSRRNKLNEVRQPATAVS